MSSTLAPLFRTLSGTTSVMKLYPWLPQRPCERGEHHLCSGTWWRTDGVVRALCSCICHWKGLS